MNSVRYDTTGENAAELARLQRILDDDQAVCMALGTGIDGEFLPENQIDARRAHKAIRRERDRLMVRQAAIMTWMVALGAERVE